MSPIKFGYYCSRLLECDNFPDSDQELFSSFIRPAGGDWASLASPKIYLSSSKTTIRKRRMACLNSRTSPKCPPWGRSAAERSTTGAEVAGKPPPADAAK